jgi:zinc/manganese transport system substrate-binding protein
MNFRLLTTLACAALLASAPARADLNVFATVPEWGALVTELGGDKVKVYTATNALQDPHHVEAKPSLIARARNADLIVATGAELEIGWVPLVVQQAGNPKVRPGQPATSRRPVRADAREARAPRPREGDVHPLGNPHIPDRSAQHRARGCTALGEARELDPANAAYYQARYKAFDEAWRANIARWEHEAAPLRGTPIVVQHKAFVYLEDWLGPQGGSPRSSPSPASSRRSLT